MSGQIWPKCKNSSRTTEPLEMASNFMRLINGADWVNTTVRVPFTMRLVICHGVAMYNSLSRRSGLGRCNMCFSIISNTNASFSGSCVT